jgi:PTS system galactitol-specific IIB component
MIEKTILVSCGTGIATSTMAATKLREMLKKRGFLIHAATCKSTEVAGKIRTNRPDAIVSTTKLTLEGNVKVFSGVPLLTGVGANDLVNSIVEYLSEEH